VQNLSVEFGSGPGRVIAVNNVSFQLAKGETLGIVGESGSGKSVTALALMGLIPTPPGKISSGIINFYGQDLLKLSPARMKNIRGKEIAMVFQDPFTSLNPVYPIGDQIAEAIRLHQGVSRKESLDRAAEMLRRVGIPDYQARLSHYPHQMSGGMRQRVMIAMAISCRPRLLIADEPTTALDVTIQAQILELMKELREKTGMAMILITHDLGVVAQMADRVLVMYAGRVVETGHVYDLLKEPLHPYTINLKASVPRGFKRANRSKAISGTVPVVRENLTGCRFYARCPEKIELCQKSDPPLAAVTENHFVRCWKRSS
jgi:oligopeptide/dipeptide ABC transporter ATP-binding protein